jgi:hypothetical protein
MRSNRISGGIAAAFALVLLSGCWGSTRSLSESSPGGTVSIPSPPPTMAAGTVNKGETDFQHGVAAESAKPAGASVTPAPTPTVPTPASAKPVSQASTGAAGMPSVQPSKEAAYDHGSVRIVLDSEPRLISPIRTTIYPADQTFTVLFDDKMDRPSVEKVIKAGNQNRSEGVKPFKADYKFTWVDDQQLKLAVDVVESAADLPFYPLSSYSVNLKGAQTLSGLTLKNPDTFEATVLPPVQLWRVSANGMHREKLSDFQEPIAHIEVPKNAAPFAVTHRLSRYCECDMRAPYLSALFDTEHKTMQPYPSEIMLNYWGPGDFIANRKGFFVKAPGKGEMPVPLTNDDVRVRPEGFIWGTAWSKDGRRVIMARSDSFERVTNLDLILFDTETKTYEKLPGAIKGELSDREVSTEKVPVDFFDDGEYVYFSLLGLEYGKAPARYRYHWKTKTLSAWVPEVMSENSYWWIGFKDSDDGRYRLYSEGTLMKDGKTAAELSGYHYYHSFWIPRTHHLAYVKEGELTLYDADSQVNVILIKGLQEDAMPVGVSPDGKWIYIRTRGEIPSNA